LIGGIRALGVFGELLASKSAKMAMFAGAAGTVIGSFKNNLKGMKDAIQNSANLNV
jgi:hypothetical protein